jgi:hypothetical protein
MDMRWCFAVLFLSLASCVHEEETTPLIHVVPGAAARALWYDMPSSRIPPSDMTLPPVQKTVATEHPVD